MSEKIVQLNEEVIKGQIRELVRGSVEETLNELLVAEAKNLTQAARYRNWGGEYENVAILVAIAVNEDGYREVLGAAEGMKEDKASWPSFFQWLKGRGLDGVKLIVGDKSLGMLEAVGEVFPEAKYQRCVVHFYRNVFSVVPRSKVRLVAKMLKAIHAQESKKAAREKAKIVIAELQAMKLKEAAKKIEDGVEETLTYADFPSEHWTRI